MNTPETTLLRIMVEAPGAPPAGHQPVPNFWRVAVTTQSGRMHDWRVVLPLSEVLDALKTLTITEEAFSIAHPAFQEQTP